MSGTKAFPLRYRVFADQHRHLPLLPNHRQRVLYTHGHKRNLRLRHCLRLQSMDYVATVSAIR